MDIPNLSQTNSNPAKVKTLSLPIIIIILILAVTSGFFISRFFPKGNSSTLNSDIGGKNTAASTDSITNSEQLVVGKLYGNTSKDFSDKAQGKVQKGNINGVGTHILVREGGDSQRVSLTSSTVDLDLFADRKVEVKGQTNNSNKTGWLLDVGSIKILE
jgi:hypothetical protein